MAELDLSSPEIKAAMRVLGVLPKDVHPLNKAAFEGAERRYEHLEQKRRNLIDEVKRKALGSAGSTGKVGDLSAAARAERNAAFMQEVERAEAASMAEMKKKAKHEVQNVIIEELEKKVVAEKNRKRMAESENRVADLLKKRDMELAERKKQAEKQQLKTQGVRDRSFKEMEAHAHELATTLHQANERAENAIRERKEAEARQRVENREKRSYIFERQANFSETAFRERVDNYAKHCEKMEEKQKMLEERLLARASNVEELAAKQAKTQENVRKYLEEKQAKAEEKYWELCKHFDNSAETRERLLQERIKQYQTDNKKKFQAHANRYGAMVREWEQEQARKQDERLSPKSDSGGAGAALLKNFSDSVLIAAERRKNHSEVVAANRERLRRAHHYSIEQQVDKLRSMRLKVQVMEDARANADRRRMEVMSKCAREKMHMQDRVDRTKDSADPEKMYNMLEELDPDPEAIEKINDLLGQLGMQKIGFIQGGDEEGK